MHAAVVQIRKGETQWRSEWTSQQNKCKDEEVKSRSAFLKEKVGQAAVTGAKNGDLTHDVERTWKKEEVFSRQQNYTGSGAFTWQGGM